jgi:hypothetical protein
MEALARSFAALSSNLRIARLFREDSGVEGCGFFHQNLEEVSIDPRLQSTL